MADVSASNPEGLSEDLWANQMVSSVSPRQILSIFHARLASASQFNNTAAEFLRARASLEQDYAASLSKLAGKYGATGRGIDLSAVGLGDNSLRSDGQVAMWERWMRECVDTGNRHASFASTLQKEYEQPLKDMPNTLAPWKSAPEFESRIERTVKQHESNESKFQKAQKKGGAKLSQAQQELAMSQSALQTQLPGFISHHQKLAQQRLTRLKELAVKWETMQSELGDRRMKDSEIGMMAILSWEIEAEVRRAAEKMGGTRVPQNGATNSSAPVRANSVAASDFESVRSAPPRAAPARMQSIRRPTVNSDAGSINSQARSGSFRNDANQDYGPASNNLPQQSSHTLSSTLKSKFSRKSTGFGLLGSKNRDAPSSEGTVRGRDRAESSATARSNSNVRGQSAGGGFETLMDEPDTYGDSSQGLPSTAAPPMRPSQSQNNEVDAEGYSMPPADHNRAPWETRQAGGVRNLLDDEDEDESANMVAPLASPNTTSNAPRFSLAPEPVASNETEAERQAALAKMQSTLLSQAPSGGSAPNRRLTMRRREVRNTTFNTLPDDMPLGQAMKLQSFGEAQAPSNGEMADSPLTSPVSGIPTASAFTTRGFPMDRKDSQASSTNPFEPSRPLQPSGAGLRCTMSEIVNMILKGGIVQRAQITGQISLSLNDSHPGNQPITIRIDQFNELEKVAPNPKFLSQVPDRPGEYFLNPEVLAQASASQHHQPLLVKYQLHVPAERAGEYAPIDISPQWKAQAGDTRLLLAYKANSDGRLAKFAHKLTNVSFSASVGGATVSTIQAKPSGDWSPESHTMTWKLDDIELAASSPLSAGKILAKFVTDGEEPAKPEGVMVRWRADGCLTSGLSISIADADWTLQEVNRSVSSGKYIAE